MQDIPLARLDGTVVYPFLDSDLQLPFALGPRGRDQGAQADGQYCQDPAQPHVSPRRAPGVNPSRAAVSAQARHCRQQTGPRRPPSLDRAKQIGRAHV